VSAIEIVAEAPLAKAIGWALVQFVWQGALVGVLTAGLLACLRRAAADVRYVVSCLGLVVMITLFLATLLDRTAVLREQAPPAVAAEAAAAAASSAAASYVPRRTQPVAIA
jgi:bla regulator protein blaR1